MGSSLFRSLQLVKADLRHCPTCRWKLTNDHSDTYARKCITHGMVFSITIGDGGYKVEANLALKDKAFEKVRNQLRICPTCGKPLRARRNSNTVLECPDLYHGAFAIVWSRHHQRYYVSYQVKAQAVA